MQTKAYNPWSWQDQFGFSQAVEASGHQRVLVCAGQTSTNENGESQHAGDMAAQLSLAMDNLETVLTAAGMKLSNVIRLNAYTTDVDLFLQHYEPVAMRLAGGGCKPAITLLGIARLFDPALLVELEATAVA